MFVGEPLQIAMDQVRKVPPALYEVRADIDLRLDAIFQKLVAKDPIDRFQTAESVIAKLDALHLSSKKSFAMPSLSDSPLRNAEPTTNRPFGESTSQRSYDAVGIELGQMTTRASYLDNNRQLIEIPLDGEHRFIRNILWSDQERIAVGEVASQLRATQPNQIFYGFQRWIGIPVLERSFAGRRTPPEILLAILLRKVYGACQAQLPQISHAVVNVPGCYDQLHRHSILTACRAAGIEPLQLLDRPLAAALALMETQKQLNTLSNEPQNWLVICLQSSACEASVVRVEDEVASNLATVGDWRTGVSKWYHRIAELLAKKFFDLHAIDVKQDLVAASRLQRSVEIAIDRLSVVQQVELRYEAKQKEIRWTLGRLELLKLCEDLIAEMIQYAKDAIDRSKQPSNQITHLLLVGELFTIPALRDLVRKLVDSTCVVEQISKGDLARGAALQARRWIPPVESSGIRAEARSMYDIGLVTVDAEGASSVPRVLIERGTQLPTEMSRTLRPSSSSRLPQLQFVESTRLGANHWHRLGNVNPLSAFPRRPADDPLQLRLEIDSSGVLACKLSWLKGNMQYLVPPLDNPPLDLGTIQQWRNWIETLFLCQADTMDSKS